VRHNLIDFGSALGSGGVEPAEKWSGAEYLIQPGTIGAQMIGFGFRPAAWQTASFYEAPAVGRLPRNNTSFNPDLWRPRVPNRAFLQARADDKFWAAQRLMALTTEMIRAAVHAGEFGDPASEAYLVQMLVERRNAIGRAYLTAVNPIAGPELDADGVVTFRNAAVEADFARAPEGYRAAWSMFDNTTGSTRRIGESTGRTTRIVAPSELPSQAGTFVKIELSAIGGANESWQRPVHAYFRQAGGAWQLVGFERMPEDPMTAD
jgi:hypothetical protein